MYQRNFHVLCLIGMLFTNCDVNLLLYVINHPYIQGFFLKAYNLTINVLFIVPIAVGGQLRMQYNFFDQTLCLVGNLGDHLKKIIIY